MSTGSRDNSKVARSPQEETTKFGQVEKGQKQRCVVFYLYVRYIYILATACPLQICASLWTEGREAVHGCAKPKYCVLWCLHLLSGSAHPCAAGLSSNAAQPEKCMSAGQIIPNSSTEFRSCKNWENIENTALVTAGESQENCQRDEQLEEQDWKEFITIFSTNNNFLNCKIFGRGK